MATIFLYIIIYFSLGSMFTNSQTENSPSWIKYPLDDNKYCIISGNMCVSSSSFISTENMSKGCVEIFSYNTKHRTINNALNLSPLLDQSLSNVYLFDVGVDRAVHGHFMSKLMQLWSLHVNGEVITHIVFFRKDFHNILKSSLSPPQLELLHLVTHQIRSSSSKLSFIWADDIRTNYTFYQNYFQIQQQQHFQSQPISEEVMFDVKDGLFCFGKGHIGSGYENLVGSHIAAQLFSNLITNYLKNPPTKQQQEKQYYMKYLSNLDHNHHYEPSLYQPIVKERDQENTKQEKEDAQSCPEPSVLFLKRGPGSSSPRNIVNMDIVSNALVKAANQLQIKLPTLREDTISATMSLYDQIKLIRSAGLILSPHSSGLKNLVYAMPSTTVVEIQVGDDMTNAFLIDIHHFGVHYVISKNHSAAHCNQPSSPSSPSSSVSAINSIGLMNELDHSHKKQYIGVVKDVRRGKWKSFILKGGRQVSLGWYDSAIEAAKKHDIIAAQLGRSNLNFQLRDLVPQFSTSTSLNATSSSLLDDKKSVNSFGLSSNVLKRWSWKCDVVVVESLLVQSLVEALSKQLGTCPHLWE